MFRHKRVIIGFCITTQNRTKFENVRSHKTFFHCTLLRGSWKQLTIVKDFARNHSNNIQVTFKLSLANERYVYNCQHNCCVASYIQVSHVLRSLPREGVPYVKLYRYNPKHLYPKLISYGDNGHRKVWASVGSTYCTPSVTLYSFTAHAWQRDITMHCSQRTVSDVTR
jgi:hypothetical protein